MDTVIDRRLSELFSDRRPTRWVTRERPKIDRHRTPPQASSLHALSPGLTLLFDDDQALRADAVLGGTLNARP